MCIKGKHMYLKKIKYPSVFGKRNYTSDNNWETIELNKYQMDKPIVICLSGNYAMSNNLANAFCKRAERQLDLLLKNFDNRLTVPTDLVDILGCAYGSTAELKLPDMFAENREDFQSKYPTIDDYIEDHPENLSYSYVGKMHRNEIFDLVEYILLPMCSKNGNKIPVENACKNLSQVTFFSWCHGAREVSLIVKKLSYLCKKIGYNSEEIKTMLGALMHITYAASVNDNYTPAVRIDSLRDDFIFPTTNEYLDINGLHIDIDNANVEIQSYFDSIHIYTSKLTNLDSSDNDEHLITYLDRNENWDIKENHPNADCVSQIMAWVLSRSVENSLENAKSDKYIPKPDLQELLDEIVDIKNSFNQEDLMFKE